LVGKGGDRFAMNFSAFATKLCKILPPDLLHGLRPGATAPAARVGRRTVV
jgi:hypothetical protein